MRTTATFGSGYEGLDVVSENGTTAICIAQQRGWNYQVENSEKKVFDMRPSLLSNNGWITDKPEGVGVVDGQLYVVTDNDGVDGWMHLFE